jgi:glycosyltransferase involved in cell wall biosynthesis
MKENVKSFNIGFDAKRAYHNKTGLGVYSRSIIAALEQFYPKLTLILFNPKKTTSFQFNHQEITPNHFISKRFHSFWRSFLWTESHKQKIDLFHGLSAELPFNMPTTIKKVVTIHDLLFERFPSDYPFFDRFMYRLKAKYACNTADIIIAVSEATKKDLIDFYKIQSEKIIVIGIPFAQKNLTIKKTIDISKPFIVCIASFIPRKNQENLVLAFEKIASVVDFDLILVGNPRGPYFKKVQKLIQKSNISNRIHLLSQLEDNQIAWLYTNALFSVYPSHYEGFGIPVLESISYQCPVLASKIQSTVEISHEVPLFFNSKSVEDFAEKMRFLYENLESFKTNTINNRSEILKKYSDKNIADSLFKLYQQLLND